MTEPALEVVGVTKRFGNFVALDGVDLAVAPGTLHAIIGPNGAGKTTLFNILTGQLRPTSGQVRVRGRPLNRAPIHRRVRLGIARSFQVTSIFQELSVLENVRLAAQGLASRAALAFWSPLTTESEAIDRAREVVERVGLERVSRRAAAALSHGQQRLLEVAMALAPDPEILLLDEPTSGMGANDLPVMEDLLTELTGAYTIVVVEHNMALIMRAASRVAVLLSGRIVVDAEPDVVRADPQVQRAYLGQELDAPAV